MAHLRNAPASDTSLDLPPAAAGVADSDNDSDPTSNVDSGLGGGPSSPSTRQHSQSSFVVVDSYTNVARESSSASGAPTPDGLAGAPAPPALGRTRMPRGSDMSLEPIDRRLSDTALTHASLNFDDPALMADGDRDEDVEEATAPEKGRKERAHEFVRALREVTPTIPSMFRWVREWRTINLAAMAVLTVLVFLYLADPIVIIALNPDLMNNMGVSPWLFVLCVRGCAGKRPRGGATRSLTVAAAALVCAAVCAGGRRCQHRRVQHVHDRAVPGHLRRLPTSPLLLQAGTTFGPKRGGCPRRRRRRRLTRSLPPVGSGASAACSTSAA